jgi:hypothetical protein
MNDKETDRKKERKREREIVLGTERVGSVTKTERMN